MGIFWGYFIYTNQYITRGKIVKKKELEKKLKEVTEQRDMLWFFNTQISGTMISFMGLEAKAVGDGKKIEEANFFYKFNTVNFINFFNNRFYLKNTYPKEYHGISKDWIDYLEKTLKPEFKRVTDEFKNKSEKDSYFQ